MSRSLFAASVVVLVVLCVAQAAEVGKGNARARLQRKGLDAEAVSPVRTTFPRFRSLLQAAVSYPWQMDADDDKGIIDKTVFNTMKQGDADLYKTMLNERFPEAMKLLFDGADGGETDRHLRFQVQRDGRAAGMARFLHQFVEVTRHKREMMEGLIRLPELQAKLKVATELYELEYPTLQQAKGQNFKPLPKDQKTIAELKEKLKGMIVSASQDPRGLAAEIKALTDKGLTVASPAMLKRAAYNLKNWPKITDMTLRGIFQLLYTESAYDPPYFVSHAADHGARTMLLAQQLEAAIGATFTQAVATTSLTDPNEKLEGWDEKVLMGAFGPSLVNSLMCLVHDVGYYRMPSPLTLIPPLKWIHGPNGAEMIRTELGYTGLGLIIGRRAYKGIVRAVKFHNADSKKCERIDVSKVPVDGKCRFPTAFLDADGSAGFIRRDEVATAAVRQYVPASMEADPLVFAVRWADNLDFARARLPHFQQVVDMNLCWMRLYADNSLRALKMDAADWDAAHNKVKENAWCKMANTQPLELQKLGMTKEALAKTYISPPATDRQSFLHYYSNYAVKSAKLDVAQQKYLLTVTFYDDLPNELSVAKWPAAALYQVYRFCEAVNSLSLAGKNLNELIQVKLENFAWPQVGGTMKAGDDKLEYALGSFCPKVAETKKSWCEAFRDKFSRVSAEQCYDNADDNTADKACAAHPIYERAVKDDCANAPDDPKIPVEADRPEFTLDAMDFPEGPKV